MSIIDHTLNKCGILFHTYSDLFPLNFVYFLLENDNFVLEMSWKIIFPWLWKQLYKQNINLGIPTEIDNCEQVLPHRKTKYPVLANYFKSFFL